MVGAEPGRPCSLTPLPTGDRVSAAPPASPLARSSRSTPESSSNSAALTHSCKPWVCPGSSRTPPSPLAPNPTPTFPSQPRASLHPSQGLARLLHHPPALVPAPASNPVLGWLPPVSQIPGGQSGSQVSFSPSPHTHTHTHTQRHTQAHTYTYAHTYTQTHWAVWVGLSLSLHTHTHTHTPVI